MLTLSALRSAICESEKKKGDPMEKTNKIQLSTALKLGGALMGTCIGSGFATGSECLSFFITYGIKGAIGALIISFVIYLLFTRELFNKGQELPEEQCTSLFTYYFGKTVGSILDWFCAILVGGCYLIMLSGVGTTIHQYFDIPVVAGSAIMAAAVIVTVWFGLRKLTSLIGLISPFMAALTIIIGVMALFKADFSSTASTLEQLHLPKAAPTWWIAGILYPCFCMLTLTPALPSIIYILMPTQTLILALCIVFYMVSALCIMSTWALQFVPVSEVEIPMVVTGSAIGVISMFSFVSDIFYSAVCGHFIDTYGLGGYKWIFVMTVVVLLAGAAACMYIVKKIKARKAKTL